MPTHATASDTAAPSPIHAAVAEDFAAVNRTIMAQLGSRIPLVETIGQYIIASGGKRLRPLLVLLAAHACGCHNRHHLELAAVIEFIHTATLLHDDVVDASNLRRGRQTANAIWGNEASVLVGDFLYSRAFEMMVGAGDMRIMEIMAHTTNTIAEGEVMQLLHCHDADTGEARYREVIRCKTAKLFEAAARIGAVLGDRPPEVEEAMSRYGIHLGMAFQLIDDALDYSADPEETGKNLGDDLAEGKPTLPLIHALRKGNAEQARTVRRAIEEGGRTDIQAVQQAIESTGAIAYTAESARAEAEQAMEALAGIPDSPYREALYALADFSVNRSY